MAGRVLQANDKGIKTEISRSEKAKKKKTVYKKINKRIFIEALFGIVKDKQTLPSPSHPPNWKH